MKFILALFLSSFLISSIVSAQINFNKQYHFDGIAAIGNGVHVTDSCYYISGLVVDTINGDIYDGLLIGSLDIEGNLQEYRLHLDSLSDYENWNTPLLFNDGGFTSVGFGKDSLSYLYWMRLNIENQIVAERKFRSPFSPEDWFIHPYDVSYSTQDKRYYITSEVGYYLPNGVLNGEFSLLCLDSMGNKLWDYTYGDSWMDNPLSLARLSNNTIVVGTTHSNYNLASLNKIYHTRLVAIDINGQLQWTWTSPSQVQQGANDIVAEPDGSLIVASGRGFLQYVNPGTNAMLWDRGLIFKLDLDRNIEWEAEFTEPGPTFENRIEKLVKAPNDSGYTAAGKMRVWLNEDNASLLGWLVKVSPEGDSLWSRKLFYYEQTDSIEYEHHIHDLQTTPDGGYFMSGYTLDREGGAPSPRQRAWFIKVDSEGCLIPGCGLVDAEEPDTEGPPLLLYPNPAAEHLNVYLGDSGGQQWTFLLFDAAGRQLSSYAAPTSHTTYMLPVAGYPAGSYYLQVANEQGRRLKSYQWVKQ